MDDHITLTVRAFASLRELMDPRLTLTLPAGATVRTLLAELTRRYEGLDEHLFATPETLHALVNILKNSRNIQFLAGLETVLDDGDVIAMFPPIGGG